MLLMNGCNNTCYSIIIKAIPLNWEWYIVIIMFEYKYFTIYSDGIEYKAQTNSLSCYWRSIWSTGNTWSWLVNNLSHSYNVSCVCLMIGCIDLWIHSRWLSLQVLTVHNNIHIYHTISIIPCIKNFWFV